MDHKIILKCRVCLDECEENKMFDLFEECSTIKQRSNDNKKYFKLYEKLEYCCGVRIRESTEMPTKICFKCFDITRIWYNFRQVCVNSQIYLEIMSKGQKMKSDVEYYDNDYLECLVEDLQAFRSDSHCKNNDSQSIDLSSLLIDSDNSNLFLSDEENIDDTKDSGIKNIFENPKGECIADEKEDVSTLDTNSNIDEDGNDSDKNDSQHSTRSGKRKTMTKDQLPKKRYRSAPTSSSSTSYMCSICGNVFTKRSAFTYHMNLHYNVKPHECELCDKRFRQICELKNHMRRHTREKPYKCSYCDRHFIDRSERHRHEKVHTNTRPYVCKECGKSFTYSAILKNHSKLHSGEKDYNCFICEKAFTLKHQLKAHLQTITHKQREEQFIAAGYILQNNESI